MDLPTYTSIWRIEKRLYKLYDFRLPMPLPIGQVTVFAAMAVPYVALLTLLGLPFNHTLIWLYILPPGLATWLVTRPVLESKRLPELIKSQLRYLAEPRILCRMAPLAERDVVVVTGRIWRPRAGRRGAAPPPAEVPAAAMPADGSAGALPARARRRPLPLRRSGQVRPGTGQTASPGALPALVAGAPESSGPARPPSAWAAGSLPASPGRLPQAGGPLSSWPSASSARARHARSAASWADGANLMDAAWPAHRAEIRLVASGRPARPPPPAAPARAVPPAAEQAAYSESAPAQPAPDLSAPDLSAPDLSAPDLPDLSAPARPAPDLSAPDLSAPDMSASHAPGPATPPSALPAADPHVPASPASDEDHVPSRPSPARPVVTVVDSGASRATPPAVERALAGPSARRGDVRAGRVSVVPGGHRPGKPDLLQRDRARAQLPIGIRARVVVLGCTVGAGQTTTTLMAGEVLASLRSDQVAVIDFNPGTGGLTRRAEARPALSQAALTGRSRLAVLGPQRAPVAGHGGPAGQAVPAGQAAPAAQADLPRDPAVDAITFEAATDRYEIVIADPATVAVPRLLAIADQLVLVAPASAAAPGAIAMTFEWLEAHGQADLAAASIMVLNGVSRRSMSFVEQAERVCAGRCRAIVRVPWDDQLHGQTAKRAHPAAPGSQARQHWAGVLSPPGAGAYTALAGVLVTSLAGHGQGHERGVAGDRPAGSAGRDHEPAHAGQAER